MRPRPPFRNMLPPGHEANPQPELFHPDTAFQPPAEPGRDDYVEPLPEYMLDLFSSAGITGCMEPGQQLEWNNMSHTAGQFSDASASVASDGQWIEFRLRWLTGRVQRLRLSRYMNVLALEDTAGIADAETIAVASARVLLDFRTGASELMLTH